MRRCDNARLGAGFPPHEGGDESFVFDGALAMSTGRFGRVLTGLLGLPEPPRLVRAETPYAAQPLLGRAVLVGGGGDLRWAAEIVPALAGAGAQIQVAAGQPGVSTIKRAAAAAGVALKTEPNEEDRANAAYAYVFDASGFATPDDLRALFDFLQPRIRRLPKNGRVVLLAAAESTTPAAAAAAQALRGFTRALAKELGRKGSSANLLAVAAGAATALAGPLRFLLSDYSAFITGQTLILSAPVTEPGAFVKPLAGKTALVTGAARGIGAAIAAALAREGAQVVGVDRPQEQAALTQTLAPFAGRGVALDITAVDSPQSLAQLLADEFGGADIVVHNAGITRDKLLRNMSVPIWDQVVDVNLGAVLRIDTALLASAGLKPAARIVCVSSIGGIAGNAGQTNYSATKAGLIGYVEALAPTLAARGGAINAVAPGFIETQMTQAMPMLPREIGRRLSSFSQGGLPSDIAEAVTFLASPLAAAVNGRTLRVCGQNFVGA